MCQITSLAGVETGHFAKIYLSAKWFLAFRGHGAGAAGWLVSGWLGGWVAGGWVASGWVGWVMVSGE